MKGNLIIKKNNCFYNIYNNLVNVYVYGDKNKIINQFNITRMFIHGNDNVVEVLNTGNINKIKIFGNNNKILLKNDSETEYSDKGIGNMLKKVHDKPKNENQKYCFELVYEILDYEDKCDCDCNYFEQQILNQYFVNNNKDKCKIIYKNEEYEIKQYLEYLDFDYRGLDSISFKLSGINNITDMSNMFSHCDTLISFSDISKMDTSKVVNMANMFRECYSLKSLKGISNWNTSNVKDMSGLFAQCESLQSLPDISNWDTSNVEDISWMFYECEKLISLPDISKWNLSNNKKIHGIFCRCISLISLPDISKSNI